MKYAVCLAAALVVMGFASTTVPAQVKPNVVLILMDDIPTTDLQVLLNKGHLPNIKFLLDTGVEFTRAFSGGSVGSTSRVSILTGQYAHNHKEFGADLFFGGAPKHSEVSLLPNWLRPVGYITGKVGRTIPGYGAGDLTAEEIQQIAAGHPSLTADQLRLFYSSFPPSTHVPPGWDLWEVFTEPSTWSVTDYKVSHNGRRYDWGQYNRPVEQIHQTDFVAWRGVQFIRALAGAGRPWFLELSPVAYNRELWPGPSIYNVCPDPEHPAAWWFGGPYWGVSARPPLRHLNSIWDAEDPNGAAAAAAEFGFPLPPSFNEADVSDKPMWVQRIPSITPLEADCARKRYWRRLETVRSIDDLLGHVVEALSQTGQLDNTFIILTSDNGMLDGQHRYNEKLSAYEESILVPLIIRRPDNTVPIKVDKMVMAIDIAPTVAHLAGATPNITVDGRSLLPLIANPGIAWRKIGLLHHTLGAWDAGEQSSAPREYYGLRIANGSQRLFVNYPSTLTGLPGEYYNMEIDPFQLENQYGVASEEVQRILPWLNAMKSCTGAWCRWLEDNFNR